MPNRMERFSQRARRVLSRAEEEAERLSQHEIDTEHILLGLMRGEGGIAARVLTGLGLELFQVRALVEDRSSDKPRSPGQVRPDLAAGAKKTLELAVDEARNLGHRYIGTEHLLLGLLRLPEGLALDVLRQLNIDFADIRRGIDRVLREHAETASSISSPPSPRRPAAGSIEYFLLRMSSRSSGLISHFPLDLSTGVKEALEEALKEVGHSGSFLLEERHLLLGLLQDPESAVSRALQDMGIDREELIRKLRNPPGD